MWKAAGIVLVLLIPTLFGFAVIGSVRLQDKVSRTLRNRRYRVAAANPPIERIALDLRRLHHSMSEAEDAPASSPGRKIRLRALRSAYVDTLLDACHALDVPADEMTADTVTTAQIFALESALRDRGLDVHPTLTT